MMIPSPTNTAEDVKIFLRYYLREQKEIGVKKSVVISGEIHRLLELENKLPMVCSAMYAIMEKNDRVLAEKPDKYGSGVVIEYDLDRE